jgi:hypothetical protein
MSEVTIPFCVRKLVAKEFVPSSLKSLPGTSAEFSPAMMKHSMMLQAMLSLGKVFSKI